MNNLESVVSPPAPEAEPAPRFRRFLAFVVDFAVALGFAHIVAGLAFVLAPPDSGTVIVWTTWVSLAVAFAYLGFATPIVGNSIGKACLGLRIVPETGGRVGVHRWMVRVLLMALWPINAIMALVHPRRQHLADLAASTRVQQDARRGFLGFVLALACAALVLRGGSMALVLGTWRTDAWQTAKAHVEVQMGSPAARLPEGFMLTGDFGRFDLTGADQAWRVTVVRTGEDWTVRDVGQIDEASGGAMFAHGAVSIVSSF